MCIDIFGFFEVRVSWVYFKGGGRMLEGCGEGEVFREAVFFYLRKIGFLIGISVAFFNFVFFLEYISSGYICFLLIFIVILVGGYWRFILGIRILRLFRGYR